MSIYGYCRISRPTQNIQRQVRNIIAVYPSASIVQETYTGTKMDGRKELDKLLKNKIKAGDTIVFDSASRMSRNADEAMELYWSLYNKHINLVFLKEPHINTDTFRNALDNRIKVTTSNVDSSAAKLIDTIIDALNGYTIDLIKEQIRLVFAQAQKEVDDLHQRTAEGLLTAKLNGKRVGLPKGTKLATKKSIRAKETILKYSKDFNPNGLSDADLIKVAGISRNTLYKYKRELVQDI